MPNWNDLTNEIKTESNVFDKTRRKYLKLLSEKTHRNTIIYYSAFLQKGELCQRGVRFGIEDSDKTGFMTAIHKLDREKGLDLILHTPGGEVAATESLVNYLKSMFGNNIRAIIPQIAMSAGTMIACACKEIMMGKQSNLGPIDPQFGNVPAHGILEEFETAKTEIFKDQRNIALWQYVLCKYSPTLIGECQKAITWSEKMVSEWLSANMLKDDPDKEKKANDIVKALSNHGETYSHNRHLHAEYLKSLGLKIIDMEDDNEIQDLILSVHHAATITMTNTSSIKIIENQNGVSFVTQVS